MKKTKFLSLVLIVAVMLMGAGYAYWTQELKITNTVKTGDLKVEFLPLLVEELDDGLDHGGYDNEWPYDKEYIDVNLNFSSDKLTVDFKKLYPGSGGYLRFRIGNSGTVPARVTNIEGLLKGSTTTEQLDKFDYVIQSLVLYTPIKGYKPVFTGNWWDPIDWQYYEKISIIHHIPGVGDLLPIRADTFEQFVQLLEERLSKYTLEPYAFFEINGEGAGYHIELPPSIEDMENVSGLGFDLNITFQQVE